MANYEYMNAQDLDGRASAFVGHKLYDMLSDGAIRTLLKQRNLRGVVKRHTDTPDHSVRHIHEVTRQVREQKLAAFVILDATADRRNTTLYDRTVGMATIQYGLPLDRHIVPLVPASVARKAHLVEAVATPRANVAAWFGHEAHLDNLRADIAEAYGYLHLQAPDSWTLGTELRSRQLSRDYHDGLQDAMYWPVTDAAHYDDGEARLRPAPSGRMFVAQDDMLGS